MQGHVKIFIAHGVCSLASSLLLVIDVCMYTKFGAYLLVTATACSSSADISEPIEVYCSGGVRGENALHEGEQSLQALQVLPGRLVIHDVGCIHGVSNLFSGTSVVNTNACHTNRPRCISCNHHRLCEILVSLIVKIFFESKTRYSCLKRVCQIALA